MKLTQMTATLYSLMLLLLLLLILFIVATTVVQKMQCTLVKYFDNGQVFFGDRENYFC